jgi:hypothetical protein
MTTMISTNLPNNPSMIDLATSFFSPHSQRQRMNDQNSPNARRSKSYCPLTRRKQVVFVTQVLSTVSLSETSDTGRIQSSGLSSAAGSDTKSERCVVHAVDNNSLVFGAVL